MLIKLALQLKQNRKKIHNLTNFYLLFYIKLEFFIKSNINFFQKGEKVTKLCKRWQKGEKGEKSEKGEKVTTLDTLQKDHRREADEVQGKEVLQKA